MKREYLVISLLLVLALLGTIARGQTSGPATQGAASAPTTAPATSPSGETLSGGVKYVWRAGGWSREAAATTTSAPTAETQPAVLPPSLKALADQQEKRKKADALIQQLATVPAEQTARIEQGLLELGPSAMVPLKLAEMSENFELRQRAAKVASRLRWRFACSPELLEAHPKLVEAMGGEDAQARAAKVDEIAASADDKAIDFLGECLADPQTYVRQRAIDGLVRVTKQESSRDEGKDAARRQAVVRLLEMALGDTDRNIRLLAVGAMADIRAVNVARVAKLLDDDSLEVRLTAVRALGFSRDPAAVEHVKPLLTDGQWRIRAAAMEAMDALVDSEKSAPHVPAVFARLDDEDDYVRALAAKTLGNWRTASAAPRVLAMTLEGRLSEEQGFSALARMKYKPGLDELLSRHSQAKDAARKVQLLGMLCQFEANPDVDARLREALADAGMKEHRPAVIGLAAGRREFFAVICAFLESEDLATAEAAWQGLRHQFYEFRLPADLAGRMLDSPDARKTAWALRAAYAFNDADLPPLLSKHLRNPSGEVAALVLAIMAEQSFLDSFGEDLPYQKDRSSSSDRRTRGRESMPADLVARIAEAMRRKEPLVRMRAAAVLYRAGANTGEDVSKMLRAGLTDADVNVRSTAMAGITERPQPFLDGFDVVAAAKDSQTRRRGIEIMANTGDSKYTKTLIDLAGGENDYGDDRLLMKALIRIGDEQAFAFVAKKLSGRRESYEIRSLAEQLKGVAGPGPVRFIEMALAQKMDEWDRRQLAEVLLTLPDPSAKPLLKNLVNDKALAYDRQKMLVRLAELDPAEGVAVLKQSLLEGDADQQGSTIDAITATKATAQMVDLVLEAARKGAKDAAPEWSRVAYWLPPADMRGRFLPVLEELNAPMQQGVLERLTWDLSAKDLDMLVGTSVRGGFAREYLAGLIGLLTAADADKRPAVDKLPEKSLPGVLSAAGDWEDAPAVVGPYLNDPRKEVASAARRGLALYLLGNPPGKPGDGNAAGRDGWRDALLEAVRGDEPITAYLAAEALGLLWKDTLLRVEPNAIKSGAAAMRQAVAFGANPPPEVRKRVAATLIGPAGATAAQLALVSAAQAPDPSYQLTSGDVCEGPRDPLFIRALVACAPEEILRLPSWNLCCLRPKEDQEVIRKLVDKARRGPGEAFLNAAEGGLIGKPEAGDLRRLLESAGISGRENPDSVMELALAWAPDAPDDTILKMVDPNSTPGVLAATVAAVKWKLPDARKALVQAVTSGGKGREGAFDTYQNLAASALRLSGQPEDAAAIGEAMKKINLDNSEGLHVWVDLLDVVSCIAPEEAGKTLSTAVWHPRGRDFAFGPAGATLAALWADAPDANLPEVLGGPEDRRDRDAQVVSWLASAREEFRTGIKEKTPSTRAGDGPSTVPSTFPIRPREKPVASAPAPREDDIGRNLYPPWDRGSSYDETGDLFSGGEAAKARLSGRIEMIKRTAERYRSAPSSAPPGQDSEELNALDEEPPPRGLFSRGDNPDRPPEELYLPAGRFYHYRPCPVALYLPEEQLAGRLGPFLEGESEGGRVQAMRAAAEWQIPSLGERIAKRLSADSEETIEAAWALAALRGPAAAGEIEQAYRRQKDFDRRVRLACLLRLLGSEAGRADIDRAIALRTVRYFRLKFMQAGQGYSARDRYNERFREGRDYPTANLNQRLMPWEGALGLAAWELIAQADGRFPLPPGWQRNEDLLERGETETPPVRAPEWKPRLSGDGTLSGKGLSDNDLPVLELVRMYAPPRYEMDRYRSRGGQDLLFARLCAAEQAYEPHFFVQFADRAKDLMDLQDLWAAWWSANRDKPREDWWRQAAGQAVTELTHAKWWHRMRAVRRLERLTGRRVEAPNVFDMPAWSRLRQDWEGWLKANEPVSPRAWLLKAGVAANALPPGAEGHGADDAAYVADLVKLAGFARQPLAEAALLQLEAWPDRRGLVIAAIAWQHSPRRELAAWARDHLRELTGKPRFVYVPADLPGRASRGK